MKTRLLNILGLALLILSIILVSKDLVIANGIMIIGVIFLIPDYLIFVLKKGKNDRLTPYWIAKFIALLLFLFILVFAIIVQLLE